MGEALQLRWTSAARTDTGLVRSNNEDAVLDRPARRMWAVDSRNRSRSKSSIVLACTVMSELKTSSITWWKPIERVRTPSDIARILRLR